jgi:hypothetical protein
MAERKMLVGNGRVEPVRLNLLICGDCGDRFTFSAAEQERYAEQRWTPPKRCKACRERRRRELDKLEARGDSSWRS